MTQCRMFGVVVMFVIVILLLIPIMKISEGIEQTQQAKKDLRASLIKLEMARQDIVLDMCMESWKEWSSEFDNVSCHIGESESDCLLKRLEADYLRQDMELCLIKNRYYTNVR